MQIDVLRLTELHFLSQYAGNLTSGDLTSGNKTLYVVLHGLCLKTTLIFVWAEMSTALNSVKNFAFRFSRAVRVEFSYLYSI